MEALNAMLDRAPSGALRAFTEHCASLCEHLVGHENYGAHCTARQAQIAATFHRYHKTRDAKEAARFTAEALAFAGEAPFPETVRNLKGALEEMLDAEEPSL